MAFRVTQQAPAFLVVLLLAVFAGCTANHSSKARRKTGQTHVAESSGTTTRRVYPYSLIPGGVESAAELQTYSAVDSALADHYRGIGAGLVLTKSNEDQRLYASYRIAGAIYWTKNRILVHADEGVLSNGRDMIRARCGNRLSVTPQLPINKFEPPLVYTDRFIPQVVVLQPPGLIEPYAPPALPDFPAVAPPVRSSLPPAVETGGGRTGVPPAILTGSGRLPVAVNTPEPSTWLLLLTGGLALGTLKYRRALMAALRRYSDSARS
jgi:hypothetical protein